MIIDPAILALEQFSVCRRIRLSLGSAKIDSSSWIGRPNEERPTPLACMSMRPSMFLELAPPLDHHDIDWMREHIQQGGSFHPPMLHVDPWPDHICDGYPAVVTHDGRHRMTCILDLFGDAPVPVLVSGIHCDPGEEFLTGMRTAIWSQPDSGRNAHLVKGPVFDSIALDGAVHSSLGLDELHEFFAP